MRVTITGGAGFIGSHIADRLLARGDDVAIVDNFATGLRTTVPEGALLVEGSIADQAVLEECIGRFGPDVVVHCAASYRDPDAWEADVETNAAGSALVA